MDRAVVGTQETPVPVETRRLPMPPKALAVSCSPPTLVLAKIPVPPTLRLVVTLALVLTLKAYGPEVAPTPKVVNNPAPFTSSL